MISYFIKNSKYLFILSLLTASLCSCLRTELEVPYQDSAFNKLKNAPGTPIEVEVSSIETIDNSGNQYLLFAIPFGSVTVSNPSLRVQQSLERNLATRGYSFNQHTQTPRRSRRSKPSIKVSVQELSVTGYDLFLTRNVVARIKLEASLYDSESGRLISQTHTQVKENIYRSQAFKNELNEVIDLAVNKASTDIIEDFNL